MFLALLMAQAEKIAADPITILPGWGAAGLLGAVLLWLFTKHLPAKDTQIEKLIAVKDKAVKDLTEDNAEIVQKLNADHRAAVEKVVDHCERQAKADREASERRHQEAMGWLGKIYGSCRDAAHATNNLAHGLKMRTFLADALQSAEVPTWTKYLDGTLTSWNGSCEKLLGWKQGEVVGKSIYESIIPPERKAEEESVLKRIASGETVEEYETDRMDKRGRRVCVFVVTSPIRDQTGKVIGASTIARLPDH
jgi:PAS domain S-box-containing protein